MRPMLRSLPLVAGLALAAVHAGHAQPVPPIPPQGMPHELPKIVAVWGEGEARAAPDIAYTTLTVLRTAETAREALDLANAAAEEVIAAMREFGIEGRDLQTSGFSITPQYRYENRQDGTTVPPEIVGYEVRNGLTVRVRDLGRLGEILDRAVELGVNQGGDIRFDIEDSAALEDEARRDAVEKARSSAEVLAAAAGVELGRVVSISDEAGPGAPIPMAREMRMMAAAPADASVPVETGENTITSRVRVVYELGPDVQGGAGNGSEGAPAGGPEELGAGEE